MKNELKPTIDEVLSAESVKKRGIFCHEAITRIRELDSAGNRTFLIRSSQSFVLSCGVACF